MPSSTSIRVATDMEEQQILGWDTPVFDMHCPPPFTRQKKKQQLRTFLVHYNTENNIKILSLTMFYGGNVCSHQKVFPNVLAIL